jgi:CHAT domain-containing protein/tetratricopeptide (TPR) repeat protein
VKALTASIALLLLVGGCHHEDTGPGGKWGRTVEPRLTTTSSWHSYTRKLSPGHVVIDAQCATPPILLGRCDEVIDSREQADRMLLSPQCTDAAIAALENLSRADAAALSDLAGAYYVRAQRNDTPADMLNAFDAARKAVALRPLPAGARFNYALVLEALSLNDEAIKAWQRAAETEEGEWANEARARRAALIRVMSVDGEHQWAQVRASIDAALDAHDVKEARHLIAAFPATSEKYFEEEVLRRWADSPSPRQLARVKAFAEALSEFFHDDYFTDVAVAIDKTRSPERLRAGHLRFSEARGDVSSSNAARLYDGAARLLQQSGSPQYLLARIGYAAQNVLQTDDYEAALRQLEAVAADARKYPSVIARVELNRLFHDQFASHYNNYFASYDAAKGAYDRVGNWEDRFALASHAVATMSVVGLKKPAWREAFVAMQDMPRLPSLRTRYLLTGATADAALNLGHPEAALLYQNILSESARAPENNRYLYSILDHRAAIEVRLRLYEAAQRDLDEATHLEHIDPDVRRSLETRLAAVRGEMALNVDPSRAIAPLTDAIKAARKTEFATFRAMLFARRADAFGRMGRAAEAEADRREALSQLHAEEEQILSGRTPGKEDDRWNSYFSRFEETYDLLIRQLIDERDARGAFQYAERARAYEPLDLVRRLPTAPAAFRELADAGSVDIAKLQAQLPPSTFLIEYRVFEDQTYAWIVSHDLFTGQAVLARRGDVMRWTKALQDAANGKNSAAFDAGLEAPYDGLLKTPLELIHRSPGGAAANVVIVPDRDLRGLPFAALRNPDTKRYVIEDHALSMSGSALLYVFAVLRDRDLASRDASALLIGDPAFDPRSTLAQGLQRLTFARKEVDAIHLMYPHSEVLMDAAATPQQFLRLAGGNAIIHIAAHGVVNGDAPSQSFLLFHDVLTAEMLMKELHTDKTRLVVLGACSSAGGLPVGTEGIAPLVRPIVAAGVPGVIGALWDIDDATASTLLVSFHRHYQMGEDAAEALRQAQLEWLRGSNPGRRSGLRWAPFQAIGYASSPFAPVGDITKEKPP